MGNEFAPTLNWAFRVDGYQMGNGVVLGRLNDGFGGVDHMVVGFNTLYIGVLFVEEFLDGSRAFIVEDVQCWFVAFSSSLS